MATQSQINLGKHLRGLFGTATPDELADVGSLPTPLSEIAALEPTDGDVLTRAMGAWVSAPPSGGGGSSSFILMNDSNLDSGWFTGVANEKPYAVDTTSGPAFCQLPASPAVGDTIEFADAKGTWNDHAFTINRNGKKIEGLEVDYLDIAQGTQFFIVYIDDTTGWKIYESGTKPHILVAPTAPTGSTSVTSVLTADNGTWTGSPTSYSYQWKNSPDGTTWTNISGATSSTYTLQSSDLGLYISCEVIAANSNGSSFPILSAATGAVISAPTASITLHFNGSDGATVFPDTSGNARIVTVGGSAAITTADSVFGGGCLMLDGTASTGVNFAGLDLNTGDFTIEFRFRTTGSQPTYAQLVGNEDPDTLVGFTLLLTGGYFQFYHLGVMVLFSSSVCDDGSWHSAALVRSGIDLKLYIDGVLNAAGIDFSDVNSYLWSVGCSLAFSDRALVGNIDEFRVTPVAQYLTDYTPATSEFVP